MRVLVAFDKFKDALSAPAACTAAANALREKHPDWQLDLCPLADGGEGFSAILGEAARGRPESAVVRGPLGPSVTAEFTRVATANLPAAARALLPQLPEGTLAVVEMAAASGLARVPAEARDPWRTSTFGTGQLLAAAARGADALLLGVGGSATNDLGLGALAALGVRFFAAGNDAIENPCPNTWERLECIEVAARVGLPPVFIACDVANPLLGPAGAAAIFGPQKGLRADDVPRLDALAKKMAGKLCAAGGCAAGLVEKPGTGAAGGLGFGLMVAFGARLVPGAALVEAWLDLPARIAAADIVITGEGRFDATSLSGKGPGRLFTQARRQGKSAHVFAGSLGVAPSAHLHAITPDGVPLATALTQTAGRLAAAVAGTVLLPE